MVLSHTWQLQVEYPSHVPVQRGGAILILYLSHAPQPALEKGGVHSRYGMVSRGSAPSCKCNPVTSVTVRGERKEGDQSSLFDPSLTIIYLSRPKRLVLFPVHVSAKSSYFPPTSLAGKLHVCKKEPAFFPARISVTDANTLGERDSCDLFIEASLSSPVTSTFTFPKSSICWIDRALFA